MGRPDIGVTAPGRTLPPRVGATVGRASPSRVRVETSAAWRVTVASANWPDVARNPNTNAKPGDDEEVMIAHNTVHHSKVYPSRLLAPVVGGDATPTA